LFGKKSRSSGVKRPDKNIVWWYEGSEAKARVEFIKDAQKKSQDGYYPVSENYTQGQYSGWDFFGAFLLCFILIGIIVFIYMLIVKPKGRLTVTYEYREAENEIACPMCAEKIKAAARVCRFCNHPLIESESEAIIPEQRLSQNKLRTREKSIAKSEPTFHGSYQEKPNHRRQKTHVNSQEKPKKERGLPPAHRR